jgi:integrase
MTAETMKKHTGVHVRRGTNVYQWRIKVPVDLRHAYKSQWAHRCSLGTADLRKANEKAAKLYAEWLARFEAQRRSSNPNKVDQLTPDLARALAASLKHDCLAVDEELRTNPMKWSIGGGLSARLRGMPEVLADSLHEVNTERFEALSTAVARGQIGEALGGMQQAGAKLGISFDSETPGFADALQECLVALKEAYSLRLRRDKGEVIATPSPVSPSPSVAPQEHVVLLRDVFDSWKAAKVRGTDAVKACERALKLFEQHTGNPPIQKLTRKQGSEFRSWLLTLGTSSKTAHDRLTYVKSLLGFAWQDLELLQRNPWRGLDIEYTTEARREPWTSDQIEAFFQLPLFTEYALPSKWNAAADAAYWIPLLGLYTGARIGELCQLRTEDVVVDSGVAAIKITDAGEGARVKTEASVRSVPVHTELIRLGFLDYVDRTKAAGHKQLWPVMKYRVGKPSGYFSMWFREARQQASISIPDFHSLRHTVRSCMTEAGIGEAIQDRITGHEVGGSTGTKVYSHPKAMLKKAVEAIRYPGLHLKRVFPAQ